MRIHTLLAAAGLVLGAASAANAATAAQAGANVAKRLGYSGQQAQCYSGVYARYASLNSSGKWTIVGGKRRSGPGAAFRSDLYAQCGIQR
jgi:hypothetical protein